MLVAYLLARRYGGPAGRKLAAALALFAAINVPLVYKSVDIWRTVHPKTTVVTTLDARMRVGVLELVPADHAGVDGAAHACGCGWNGRAPSWRRCGWTPKTNLRRDADDDR